MAIIGYVPLFEIPSLKDLEVDIRQEFGEKGVQKVKGSKLGLETKINYLPEIKWNKQNLEDLNRDVKKICGKVYSLKNTICNTTGYSVKNANVFSSEILPNGISTVYINLEIESNKTIRFHFSQ